MATKIIVGPPATGKSFKVHNAILAKGDERGFLSSWILLPDRYQVSAARRRIAQQGGAFGVTIGTFGTLYREILRHSDQAVPVASDPVVGRLVRQATQELLQQGALTHFAHIADKPGFLNAMRERIAEFQRAQVPPETVLAFNGPGAASVREIGIIYGAYQALLRDLGWADPEGLNWLAAQALEEDPTLGCDIRHLVVDGFDSFHRSQLTAIRLLADRLPEVLLTLPGDPARERVAHRRFRPSLDAVLEAIPEAVVERMDGAPHLPPPLVHFEGHIFEAGAQAGDPGGAVVFIEARAQADEAREALRWIKARVVRDGLHLKACALVTPDPELYRPLLQGAAAEYGVPLRFTHGDSLAAAPSIAALMDLLDLPAANWPRRLVLDTLSSPYFDLGVFDLSPETISTLEDVSLYGQVVEGLDAWREALDGLALSPEVRSLSWDEDGAWPRLPYGEQAEQLLASLLAFAARLTPPLEGTTHDWVAWLEDLLDDLDHFGRCETARDRAAGLGLRETLRALVLGESVAGEVIVDYAAFLAELRSALERAYVEPMMDWKQPAVMVLRVLEARGLRFDAVAVLGLSEGLFPEVEREDPFLSDAVREALGLDPRLGREQGGLFYQAATRADRCLLLTRPYLAEDGAVWEPSPFWTAAKTLFEGESERARPESPRALAEAGSSQELLTWAVRRGAIPRSFAEDLLPRWAHVQHASEVLAARQARGGESAHEGVLVELGGRTAADYGPEHIWSASRLESYALCPLFFLTNAALRLDPRDPPEPGYDPAQLGLVLHAVLEQVYAAASDPTNLDELLEILPEVAREEFARAPKSYGFRPTALWELEQVELLEMLRATIEGLHAISAGWTPYRYEQVFGIAGAPVLRLRTGGGEVKVRGVIDRLDRNHAGEVRVIDYKSGSGHQSPIDLINGRRLQLAIYAMGARDALGLGEPVDGFYWQIRGAKAGSLKLMKFKYSDDEGEWVGLDGAEELVRRHVERVVNGVRAGAFAPTPPADGCPAYCPAVAWCWKYIVGWRG